MDVSSKLKVAIVWRGEAGDRNRATLADSRFAALAQALAEAGFAPQPCLYDEAAAEAVREQLHGVSAALVFVNPLQDGRRRYEVDAMLRELAAAGVLVSAHPDVIDKMGVKAVLWRTRPLGWGSDVCFHADAREFAETFPARLANGPRVLKPNRGNGGQGVWKVAASGPDEVQVLPADGDRSLRTMSMRALIEARSPDFAEGGGLVDQAWQPRIGEGMVRCYMSGGRTAGFGVQQVGALVPPEAGPGGPRLYSGPEDPRFQRLGALMERDWTPGLCRLLEISPDDLPAIWDADFMLGPAAADGEDSYVLCEINVSAVFPMPEEAPRLIAVTLRRRLGRVVGPADTV